MMKKLIIFAAVLLGINALISQILLIRELIVNFSGNELTVGIILAAWFIGGAIGSLLLARTIITRIKNPSSLFPIIFAAISILIPLIIFMARCVRYVFHIPIYEMVSPLQIIFICALMLLPLSCLLSFSFVLLCKTFEKYYPKTKAAGIVYLFETLGATVAGAGFTFLLAKYFNSFQIAVVLTLLNFAFLLCLSIVQKRHTYIYLLLFVLSTAAFAGNLAGSLQNISKGLQWQGQEILSYANSPYGNISVTKTENSINFYENGSLFFTTQDEAFNEELVHIIMLKHPNPKKVLLIGSGIGGVIRQIFKHNPDRVTYLELDPLTIKIGKDFVSDEDRVSLSNPRLNIINKDARFYIKRVKEKFDIIIVNLPDPTTLQLNRFYTTEFYKEARKSLDKDGLLACRISSHESIISDELARYNASVYKTLNSAFTHVNFIPGGNLIFVASDNADTLNNNPQILIERFKDRGIDTRFLTIYHIKDKLYPYLLSYFDKRLKDQLKSSKINMDFYPICFYYDLVLWSIRFHPRLVGFFKFITNINLFGILLIIFALFVAGLFFIRKRPGSANFTVPLAIAVIGALSIMLEIIIILAFQVFYGYVYSRVGFLIALFMLGLALGAFIMNEGLAYIKDKDPLQVFSNIIIMFLWNMLSVLIIIKVVPFLALGIVPIIFYLTILGIGVLAGVGFPLAVAILQRTNSSERAASLVWGFDLLGAMAGSFIASLIIIPVLGISQTIWLGFVLGIVTYFLLILSRQRPLQ